MAAARTRAEQLGLEVSIALVDDAGVLLVLERLDGARLHTPDAARSRPAPRQPDQDEAVCEAALATFAMLPVTDPS